MSGAILSFLGGWWTRLRPRLRAERRKVGETPEASEEPVEQVAAAKVPRSVDPLDAAGLEKSFREMVKLDERASAEARRVGIGENARAQTLEAMRQLRQIPALQSLVQGFTRAMNRTDVTVEEIVKALENDAALCVRVLGLANSVAVASAQRIEDLPTAVQMLGVVRVRRVVQAVFTLRDAGRMAEGLDWRHLWIHAFATAAIAEELERRLRPAASSNVHLAALLHDLGKIVLSTIAADAYRDVLVAAWNGEGRLEELERRWLGLDHREAGGVFARNHRLPAVVIDAIAHHGTPESAEAHRFEVALVSLANYLSKAHGLGFSGSRLDDSDGEFAELPAWKIVSEELGLAVDAETLREEFAEFIVALRVELRELRETA